MSFMPIKDNLGVPADAGMVPLWLKSKVIIGITGGIGTGKTTAAKFFYKKGISVIDADRIGHQILQQEEVKEKILSTFGKNVISENQINRQELGKIVFQNQDELKKLNNIVHPILIKKILHSIESLNETIIIIDAALLLDWNLDEICTYVILITTKKSIQIKRLMTYKKLSNKDAISRISSQKKPSRKIDFIIENNSTLSEFQEKLQKVWNLLQEKI